MLVFTLTTKNLISNEARDPFRVKRTPFSEDSLLNVSLSSDVVRQILVQDDPALKNSILVVELGLPISVNLLAWPPPNIVICLYR